MIQKMRKERVDGGKKECMQMRNRKEGWSQKQKTVVFLAFTVFLLAALLLAGALNGERALASDFSQANRGPGLAHPFGTDWLGRDMLARTLKGLSVSMILGLSASWASALIALTLGIMAATLGSKADALISYLIDLVMGIPHILLLILISLALGRGMKGVIVGILLTHWPSLARVIRGEILQLKESPYILVSEKLGKGKLWIAFHHMLPNLLPQFLAGAILMFPHAVLHESAITFLGFGLSAEQPAIGIILSESMRYLMMGSWWLAVFPGALLVGVVLSVQGLGESLRRFTDPSGAHR